MGNKFCCSSTTRRPRHTRRNFTDIPTNVPHIPLKKSSNIQEIFIEDLFLPPYYNIEILHDDLQHEQECAICFEPFYQGEIIARLECLCIYHKRCLDQWNQRKRCCPLHMDKSLLTATHEEFVSHRLDAR